MTLSLADRSTKKQKVKVLPISGRDPESQRSEMIKVGLKNIVLLGRNVLTINEHWSSGFPTRSDTNWAAQSLNMGSCLKFRIWQVEGLYYLYSENKGADQLRSYCTADLRLCFRICKKPVFL